MKDVLTLKQACIADIDFILPLIKKGARDGHFVKGYLNSRALRGAEVQLKSTIEKSFMPTTYNQIKADLYILKENNMKIGFAWMRYHSEIKCELYLYYIVKSARRKKYGYFFFNEIIKKNNVHSIYLDILKKSTYMKKIAEKNDFKFQKLNDVGAERYIKSFMTLSNNAQSKIKPFDKILNFSKKIFMTKK
jgi:hypothetical protein